MVLGQYNHPWPQMEKNVAMLALSRHGRWRSARLQYRDRDTGGCAAHAACSPFLVDAKTNELCVWLSQEK